MKIAVFEPYIAEMGGAQKVILKYCLYFQSKGHSLEIFTQRYEPKTAYPDFNKLKITTINPSQKNLSPIAFLKKFDGFDIYITNDFPSNFISIKNKPSIWICYSPKRYFYDLKQYFYENASFSGKLSLFLKHLLFKKIDKLSARKTTKIFPISKTISKRIKKYYNLDAQDIFYCGIDTTKYKSKKSKNYFLYISRLVKPKRVDLAIKAMNLIKDKDIELYIVGAGPEELNLKKLAKGNNQIKFLGAVDDKKLIELYAECLGVIFVPLDEDWGLIPLEAGASGKPIIGSNEGGLKETIIDNKTGFLIYPTPENIADKIILLNKNRELANKTGLEAKEYVKKFDWEKLLPSFEKELKLVANK